MAKTVFLNNHADIVLGYEVETTVRMTKPQISGAGAIEGVAVASGGSGYTAGNTCSVNGGAGGQVSVVSVDTGGAVTAVSIASAGTGYSTGVHGTVGGSGSGLTVNVTSVSSGTQIGTQVYPNSMAGIATSIGLLIGSTEFTVASTGSDSDGDYFIISPAAIANGSLIKTPWSTSGALRYTRAANTITLSYTAAARHDLYFATQKTSDSGLIDVKVDGATVAGSPFDLHNASTMLASVLLKEDVSSGGHTVEITANIAAPDVFVYFSKIELAEHIRQNGGFYSFRGPDGTIDDSTINFNGDWDEIGQYAFTSTIGSSAFFYPQLGEDGAVKIRVQKTPDSGIIEVYKDGVLVTEIDLYADPAAGPVDITLFSEPPDAAQDQMEIELRNKNDQNPLSIGHLFYLRGTVVVFARTDLQALTLAADYLRRVAVLRGDGAFLDAYDSSRINFDANALYACMGLLGAYQVLGGQEYLDVVKNFLSWFAGMQESNPGVPFDDGHWKIGYRVNPDDPPEPEYIPAIAPYDAQGISEIRWVDAVQCLPAFVLWWYWKLSGDNATRDALLPAFRKGIDGFITNNYDPNTGFFFSSWQYKTTPTIFLYHDAIRRYSSGGTLLNQYNDSDTGFFEYSPAVNWSSYAPSQAIGANEHYSLIAESYVEFSLALNAGDEVKWVTQTAWDVGIAEVEISNDGADWNPLTTVDGYAAAINWQQEFQIYTASQNGTKYFRIRHSGTINPAGNTQLGWQRLEARFSAGQTDVLLGLTALWLMTGAQKYAQLAIQIVRRFASRYWAESDGRWYVALEGAAPGTGNNFWYPFPHGYTVFGMKQSRYFGATNRFEESLQALEPYQDEEGGFLPPGYSEPEHIFSAFYMLGENQLAVKTDLDKFDLANEFLKGGQYFLTLAGQQVGGIVFSKRYPYLYTNIAGFACLALAGTLNPFTKQLLVLNGTTRMILPQ